MSEVMKDSAIKLFGKTINLLPDKVISDVSVAEQRHSSFASSTSQDSKDKSRDHDFNPAEETLTEAATSSESNASQEKPLRKPDKILPCPRCNSMDTKFCYYNNYNVNQPRHFCKNCQRYWTSGGTMRNVPVGSGRRKNKSAMAPNFRPIMVSDAIQAGFLISPNSGFPVSFYPTATYWSAPLVSSLGKHSREANMVRTSNFGEHLDAERSVSIRKTLRIHDPSEAAKSSTWSTLGFKNEKHGSLNGASLFKAFEWKGDRSIDSTTMVLHANPAALSRSLNFHETA